MATSDESKSPHLSNTVEDAENENEFKPETNVSTWIQSKLDNELKRLREQKAKPLPIPVKNFGIVKEDGKLYNRVELNTSMNFNKVVQILVSEEIDCEPKKGFSFVFVVLFTEAGMQASMPLLFPYVFRTDKKNDLRHWILLNNDGMRVVHHVKSFA